MTILRFLFFKFMFFVTIVMKEKSNVYKMIISRTIWCFTTHDGVPTPFLVNTLGVG